MGDQEITRQILKKYGASVAIYSEKYSEFFQVSSHKVTIGKQLEDKENKFVPILLILI